MLSPLEQGGIHQFCVFCILFPAPWPRASPLPRSFLFSRARPCPEEGRKCQVLGSQNFRRKGTSRKPRHRGQRDLSNPFLSKGREGSGSQLCPYLGGSCLQPGKAAPWKNPSIRLSPAKTTSASPQCVPTWQLWGCNSSEPKIISCPEENK